MREDLSRRVFLAGSTAALGATLLPLPARAQSESLAALAADKGLFFGTAAEGVVAATDSGFFETIAREAGCLVPEWSMKWAHLQPSEDSYDFSECDATFDMAQTNGQWLRGHTILWHSSIPDWAAPQLENRVAWDRLVLPYIAASAARYASRLRHWDVVNEAIDHDSPHALGLRQSPFVEMLGDDFVPEAFKAARAAAPGVTLYYNDFGLCAGTAWWVRKRKLVLAALERWLKAGAPIDGLGIQSHLVLGEPFDPNAFRTFLDDVAGLGLDITLSELDVREADFTLPLPQRQQAAADRVRRYLDTALDSPAVKGVMCWGLSSAHSWLRDFHDPRNLGTPYDNSMTPTAMRAAIAESFRQAPERSAA